MEKILRIPFTEVDTADLLVDAVYEGGTAKNLGSEVLSKVMHVGNSGGFRKCMKLGENGKKAKDVAYVCIYTTGEEIEWRDEIDRTLGRFTYWGDNRKAGNPMTKTKFGGNLFLQNIFAKLAVGQRKQIAPVFIFQKYCGRDVVFCGLAVPGDRRMNSQDALVSVWAQNKEGRYQNYKSTFTILNIPQIDRRWLVDLENDHGYESQYAPKAWLCWVDKNEYKPLITEKNPIQYRKANEQLPAPGSLEYQMLETLISYFADPYAFEACACKVAQIMDSNIISIEATRRTRDGGRDAVGKYRVGTIVNGIELEFALEAKRYKISNAVGVKETSRLISRIKHRQFGIFVTTSYVGDQAYKEIIEDELNVKTVEFTDDVSEFTSYSFKPQLKTVGPKYGKVLGKIKAALAELDGNKAMAQLNAEGALKFDFDGTEVVLEKDDLLIDTAQVEGYVSESDNNITVVLDTNLSPELIEEGFVREIISKIQTMRKEAGFEVMDKIVVNVSKNDSIIKVVTDNLDEIKAEVLANEIVFDKIEGYSKEWNINGEKVTLGVEKVQ